MAITLDSSFDQAFPDAQAPHSLTLASIPTIGIIPLDLRCAGVDTSVPSATWSSIGCGRSFGHSVYGYMDAQFWHESVYRTNHRVLQISLTKGVSRTTSCSFDIGAIAHSDRLYKFSLHHSF